VAKFRSPFAKNELWLTQTFHTGAGNTAIDISATAGTPVYALADGKITYRSSLAGSYCIQQVNNSDLRIYYVHTYKWVAANSIVKKGDIIAFVAPTSVNGGYPTHLHLGLQAGKYIMNYFDRGLIFKTRFSSIKKVWFIGEELNWSLFADLNYENSVMFNIGDNIELSAQTRLRAGAGTGFDEKHLIPKGAVGTVIGGPRSSQNKQFNKGDNDPYTWWDIKFIDDQGWMANVTDTRFVKTNKKVTKIDGKYPAPPPPPPQEPVPCLECKKLENDIIILRKENEALKNALSDANSLIETQKNEIKKLGAEVGQFRKDLEELQAQYDTLHVNFNRVENEKGDWMKKYDDLKKEQEQGQENFIKKITDWVGEMLAKILNRDQ
jgi:hypothetical protein